MKVKNVYYTDSEYRIGEAIWKYIFEEKYENLTVSEICAEAGVSRNTFYRHFSSVEETLVKTTATAFDTFYVDLPEKCSFEEFISYNIRNFFKYDKWLLPLVKLNLSDSLAEMIRTQFEKRGIFASLDLTQDENFSEIVKTILARACMDVFILWAQEGYVTDKKKIERLCIALYDKLIPKKVKKS